MTKITITIIGAPGSGKTTALIIFKRALQQFHLTENDMSFNLDRNTAVVDMSKIISKPNVYKKD